MNKHTINTIQCNLGRGTGFAQTAVANEKF